MLGSKKFNVKGMNCPHCEAKVNAAVSEIEGITACKANHKKDIIEVKGNIDDTTLKAMKDAISEVGFELIE